MLFYYYSIVFLRMSHTTLPHMSGTFNGWNQRRRKKNFYTFNEWETKLEIEGKRFHSAEFFVCIVLNLWSIGNSYHSFFRLSFSSLASVACLLSSSQRIVSYEEHFLIDRLFVVAVVSNGWYSAEICIVCSIFRWFCVATHTTKPCWGLNMTFHYIHV